MSLATLGQSIRNDRSDGTPLKTVWKTLEESTAVFRRGSVVMIAGGSGVGKSAFALTLAVRSEASCIYFSADSGPGTQLARAVSMISGKPERECREAIQAGQYFDKELQALRRIRWDFNAGPSLDDIQESLNAYGFLHGEYPELVIVDNLMNVVVDDSGEGGRVNKENVLMFLAELARERGCCIVVLHHVVGQYGDGATVIPLSGLMEKPDKSAEMVLTIYRVDERTLGVCIVKNRSGMANAAGGLVVELDLDFEHMKITDPV